MHVRRLAALAACLAVAGCGDDEGYDGGKYSLTVFVYDAVTRQPIGSTDLVDGLVMYEGATKVSPVVLDAALEGAVIFRDIPADYYAGNKYFPIIANVANYLPYQGKVSFAINGTDALEVGGAPSITISGAPQDQLLAQLAIIYLYPTGYQTPSYAFHVVNAAGSPVPGATVSFTPDSNPTSVVATNSAAEDAQAVITAFDGTARPLAQVTDAAGTVTFAGADLALGVPYALMVAPVTLDGVQLGAYAAPEPVTVGLSEVDQVITLPDLVPGTNPAGLYVTSVSTSLTGQVVSSGMLQITFNRPVRLNIGSSGFGLIAPPDATTAADSANTGLPPGNPVTASLSSDGLTLTLTPNWVAPLPGTPGKTANGVPQAPGDAITYTDGSASVTVIGYEGVTYSLFQLTTSDSGRVLAGNFDTVTVVAPQ